MSEVNTNLNPKVPGIDPEIAVQSAQNLNQPVDMSKKVQDWISTADNIQESLKKLTFDKPDIPPGEDADIPSESSQSSNPYYQGSSMASVFVILRQIMDLQSEIRESQNELRMDTMEEKFDSTLVSAELRKEIKMNQAFQSLTSAIGSAAEVITGGVQFAQTIKIESQAEQAYQGTLKNDQDAVASAKNKVAEKNNLQVGDYGNDPQAFNVAIDKAMKNPDQNNPEAVAAANDLKIAEKRLEKTITNEHTITSTHRQQIDLKVRTLGEMMKSSVQMTTQATNAGLQMAAAYLDERQAVQDGITDLLNSYLSGFEQATQKASSAIDEMARFLRELQQSYTQSLSTHA